MHNKKIILLITLSLFTILIIVANWSARRPWTKQTNDVQEDIQDSVNVDTSTKEVIDPMSDWEIYSNIEYGFSFKYPQGYKVEERALGFFVLSLENENVPQGGISIDVRMQGTYQSFDDAIKNVNDSYIVTKTKKFNDWHEFDVLGKDGMTKDMKFKIALSPYKTGAIAIETIDAKPYSDIFDYVVGSFK